MEPAGTVSGASGGSAPSVGGTASSQPEILPSGGVVLASVSVVASPPNEPRTSHLARQSSRLGTKAITVHFPEEVRRQLKAMAGEQGRDVSDMVAEALNLLFEKYHKPEIAPRKSYK